MPAMRPNSRDERPSSASSSASNSEETPERIAPEELSRSPRVTAKRTRQARAPEPDNGAAEVTGVVGDASAAGTRSGDDVRKRGWFWHWNNIVTQYAPLIGLKGVGLLNSYTVWTDRREESPHRGYAFPSQQSEADFYGEDRAELITINKILVALDLIEIRKEMVPRIDEKGRRWKVPHNFYRVKDHGDGFTLTSGAVIRVVELAERDRTVYRYLRRMFSPKFSPIDGDNVWHAILDELRPSDAWQRLAARTASDETRASARSKAGHASRRAAGNPDTHADFFVPEAGDTPAHEATGSASNNDSSNDSSPVGSAGATEPVQTSVARINTGLGTSDEQANRGLAENPEPDVARINTAPATSVGRSNRTYHQVKTTTTTDEINDLEPADPGMGRFGSELAPGAERGEDRAIQGYEEANDRVSTPSERRLLRGLAGQFEAAAGAGGSSGWDWLASAIDDAVAAGSTFVAPRRLREILTRWERDGAPAEYGGIPSPQRPASRRRGPEVTRNDRPSSRAARPVTGDARASHSGGREEERQVAGAEVGDVGLERDASLADEALSPVPVPVPVQAPPFVIAECGMTSRQ
ncbi:MAG: hypothetical protein H0W23_07650, partial [Chloroflexia bacterium]|nr:hypothetical protein [Chloroflexia bacterium]